MFALSEMGGLSLCQSGLARKTSHSQQFLDGPDVVGKTGCHRQGDVPGVSVLLVFHGIFSPAGSQWREHHHERGQLPETDARARRNAWSGPLIHASDVRSPVFFLHTTSVLHGSLSRHLDLPPPRMK